MVQASCTVLVWLLDALPPQEVSSQAARACLALFTDIADVPFFFGGLGLHESCGHARVQTLDPTHDPYDPNAAHRFAHPPLTKSAGYCAVTWKHEWLRNTVRQQTDD